MLRITPFDQRFCEIDEWPADVDLIISSLEAADPKTGHKRQARRRRFRVIARLTLFCAPVDAPPTKLYLRDADEKHLGFLCDEPLALGYGGTVELVGPDGQLILTGCMVYRCRECMPGWYEGMLNFNRPQPTLRFG